MSLTNIKPYFRSRLDFLGFNEWDDAFNVDNIPETTLDNAYHILLPSITGGSINQLDQPTSSAVEVLLFLKGYRNSNEAIDQAILNVETILKDVCNVVNRTSVLLNVVFDEATIDKINNANDSSVVLTLNFTAFVQVGVEEQ